MDVAIRALGLSKERASDGSHQGNVPWSSHGVLLDVMDH